MQNRKHKKPLISESLEHIDKSMFKLKLYRAALLKTIRDQNGIYILYKQDNGDRLSLYYVGKAKNLKIRLKQHLKNQHADQWQRFSFFSIKNEQYVHDLEALLIGAFNPPGNSKRPRHGGTRLKKVLDAEIKKVHNSRRNSLLGKQFVMQRSQGKNKAPKTSRSKVKPNKAAKHLKPFAHKTIRLTTKGKTYTAKIMHSGMIKYKNKIYPTPNAAINQIITHLRADGWTYWKIKNHQGKWVPLKQLKT